MLPILYSLRSDGKTQTWQIEIQGNTYRTKSGILDGETVTSEWTTCSAKNVGKKNETSPDGQAELEARALWKKKCDKGYKTSITDINDVGFFEPMLAKDYNDYEHKIKYPVFSQPKLDGVRCIITKNGMFSRAGKRIVSAPHIKDALAPTFAAYPSLIFDGELYTDKLSDNFNAIVSLAKKTKPSHTDLLESERWLEYHIYDVLADKTDDRPFSARWHLLDMLFKTILRDIECVKFVSTTFGSREEIDVLFEQYLSAGYEGQMIRLNTPYENKRSSSLLKRKVFIDEEFTIVDILEGEGNRSNMAGKIMFETASGKTFCANIRGTREIYTDLLQNKTHYIGTMATVTYFQLTPDGIPRFPVVTRLKLYD